MKRTFLLALTALIFGTASGQEDLSAQYLKLQKGEASEVIANYSYILKDTSAATPGLLQLLGDAFKIQYDYLGALNCYSRVLIKSADDKRALENAADICTLLGEPVKTIFYLEKLMPLDSSNLRIKYKLASAFQANSNIPQAIDILRQIRKADSFNFYTLKSLGDCYRISGNLDSAIYFLNIADNSNPKSMYTKMALSRINFDKEDYNSAKIYASRGLDYDSSSIPFRRQYANCCYKLKEYDEAFTHFNYIISKGDSTTAIMRLAGVSLYFLEKYEDAILYLKKCMEREEQANSQTMFYLGACLDKTGKYEDALQCLNTAYILLQPDTEIIYIVKNQTGITLNNLKDYTGAYNAFKEAYANKPEDYKLLFQMGMMKGLSGGIQNMKEARQLLQKFFNALDEKSDKMTREEAKMKTDALKYINKLNEEIFMSGGDI